MIYHLLLVPHIDAVRACHMWGRNVRRALRTSAWEANMFVDQIMLSFPGSVIQNTKLLSSIKLCTSNKNGYTVNHIL